MTPHPLLPTLAGIGVGLLAVLALTGCAAADVGSRVTEEREVTDVRSVRLQTSGALTVEHGDTPSLTVTAGDRVIDGLTSEVEGDELVLGSTTRLVGWRGVGPVSYHLVVTGIEGVAVDGSGSVELDAARQERLDVHVRGSGDVEITEVDVDRVAVQVSGSGDVRLSGETASEQVSVDGSGNVDARWLTAREATVVVRGSGDVRLDVTDHLEARVDGSGSVLHTGGARVEMQVNGSGNVAEG